LRTGYRVRLVLEPRADGGVLSRASEEATVRIDLMRPGEALKLFDERLLVKAPAGLRVERSVPLDPRHFSPLPCEQLLAL
jgi:hypothetical protein